ncbi:M23 family metallopeptidase [Limnochorda pilosa]|uniref:Peptidase n=1 Tax=Limnochorda pilosa TaxID=1555112 RepID=A0A0K2SHG6_LIMPI|nr:M23 family metallopeptidase [Limnochorda pilosa]BAS26535.1 peptidase [Limnochorda pilosa]
MKQRPCSLPPVPPLAGLSLIVVLFLAAALAPGSRAASDWDALPDRLTVEQGGLFALPLPTAADGLEVQAFGRPIPVHPVGEKSVMLVPASYHVPAGTYKLTIRSPEADHIILVEVKARAFPVQALVVPPSTEQLVRPEDPAALERKELEARKVAASRQRSAERPLWDGPFVWPVRGRITSDFGLIRTVNGEPNGRHSGLDIAAPEGTPVVAANGGVVVLAENHMTTGNTVIIDHGWRLSTSYLHLSEILVKEGQRVAKGEVVGRVGATGFATGPHLHWAANLDGVFVDPRALIDGALDF